MTLQIGWSEIFLRLAVTVIAGGIIGFNRGEHGHPAGLRTTILVCLAASISMIQMNLLLEVRGKAWDSFGVMDMMRLPLGILSGMGFIGAGVIVKKNDLVLGVTTAATLWFTTVMGLCIGGGQILLGLAALGIGMAVLWLLKDVERRIERDRRAFVTVKVLGDRPSNSELKEKFEANGLRIASWNVSYSKEPKMRELRFRVQWRDQISQPPPLIGELAEETGVLGIDWRA